MKEKFDLDCAKILDLSCEATLEFNYTRKRVAGKENKTSCEAAKEAKMSHTNLLYHIVFGTKGRYPFITKELKPRLHEYLGGTVRGLGGIAFEINGIEDHVHLLAKIKPTMCISDFIRDLKSNSSGWARDLTSGRFAWARRYGAFTVSESQFKAVRKYIQNQEKHHAKFDFKHEYENLLTANGIGIDEYVWKD